MTEAITLSLRLREARQLFDLRDPAPFRERDLDEKAVEYLTAAMSDTPKSRRVRYVLHVDEPLNDHLPADAIVEAVQTHLKYETDKTTRQLREHFRRAQLAMLIGSVALVLLLTLATLSSRVLTEGALQRVVEEGFTITAWVAMWRPLELVAYEWWPFLQRRGLLRRMMAAEWLVQAPEPVRSQGP